MNGSSIQLVCFDLGGVMIRICRSWAEGCAAAGLDVRDEPRRRETEPLRRQVILDYQTGRIGGPTFAQRISAALGGLYHPHEIMAVHHAWMGEEYPQVEHIVGHLDSRGIETACLSNTNHEHWVRAITYPAVTRLRHRLASHLLGLHKPDPAIYRALERQTGFAGPQILYFDDLAGNAAAAAALGWRAVTVDPVGDTAAQIEAALREHGLLLADSIGAMSKSAP